jgi:hypothetical protein
MLPLCLPPALSELPSIEPAPWRRLTVDAAPGPILARFLPVPSGLAVFGPPGSWLTSLTKGLIFEAAMPDVPPERSPRPEAMLSERARLPDPSALLGEFALPVAAIEEESIFLVRDRPSRALSEPSKDSSVLIFGESGQPETDAPPMPVAW